MTREEEQLTELWRWFNDHAPEVTKVMYISQLRELAQYVMRKVDIAEQIVERKAGR
jgi:hypothetical protein